MEMGLGKLFSGDQAKGQQIQPAFLELGKQDQTTFRDFRSLRESVQSAQSTIKRRHRIFSFSTLGFITAAVTAFIVMRRKES